MTRVIPWKDIAKVLPELDLVAAMEQAFLAYSRGDAVIPPVGELIFTAPPGDMHIKYGYLRGGRHAVVKIASGFPENPALGLPTSLGLMLLFETESGKPAALLLDEGKLTDIRTGAAGAVAAKHLANPGLERLGIVGTGIQARRQLELLREVTACRELVAWGRNPDRLQLFLLEARQQGFEAQAAASPEALTRGCQLIVTTTPAQKPLLEADWIEPGTHITAVGSDTAEKQELAPELMARADLLVADSLSQCESRGEIARARAAGAIPCGRAVELGALIAGQAEGRTRAEQITICDLTGVAVQDLAIASAVLEALS